MGAIILKFRKSDQADQPLTAKQKRLLEKLKAAPTMTERQYKEYKKINKWMGKWKV
jgi:hypothetical protein